MPDTITSMSRDEIPLISELTSRDREVPYNQLITQTVEVPNYKLRNTVDLAVPVGPNSCKVLCPSCRSTVYTRVEKVSTSKTYNFAMKLCFMMCCCPCALCIPYCMESCKAANHFCPHCDVFLGTYDH